VTGARRPPGPILLLGAGGQLGMELARRLARLRTVLPATRADADLERPDELRALMRRVAPSLVVNAAAYTAVDDGERNEAQCRRVNTDAPALLAEEAMRLAVPIVHYSTNYVFDGTSPDPYVEGSATAPLNVYGKTKLLGERAVSESNPAHLILRTAGVYSWAGRNFMLRMLALAREQDEIQVVDDQFVAPTLASDLADATSRIVERLLYGRWSETLFGTYHLTSGGGTSWFGFAQKILALDPLRSLHRTRRIRPVRSEKFPVAAQRPRNGLLNNGKFATHFGFVLADWAEALQRTMVSRDPS
jgi:dTDP-4-dehydrorhamnose reductase